ncbi:DUF4326 domain-containing protein [Cupriavidus sp. TMH.W2]
MESRSCAELALRCWCAPSPCHGDIIARHI